ncbi:multidrug transporter subunit MdtN [Klebsiella pneumoniae]
MMTDYILSPCSLAARGLSQLMLNAAKRPVELPVEGVSLRELAAVKRIVVYLPDDPLWMLTTLRQAARLLDEALPPLPMLILSRSPAIWLWQTLLYQVSHPDRLRNVHTAPADLSCAELAHRLENAPRLERLAGNDAYVYADTIDVVPEVSGRIVEMPIRDNQRVRKGDLLFRIDPRPYQAMLDDAKARLTTLDAQIMLTQRTIKAQEYNAQSVAAAVERARALVKQTTSTRIRLEPLVPQGFASQEDLDQARTAEKAARAELEATLLQAKQASAAVTGVDAMVAQRAGVLAQIALAELHLEFTEVRAPFNGVVVALKTTVGQYASALKPVFTLLDDDRWYVIANFRETDLNNVRPGVAARITVMTNHNRTFNGVVDSVGSGVLPEGGSVIEGLPLIQKSINWVHVSQRFPVKIAVSDPDPELFRMGASASAVLQP